ncbi:DUF4381 domain-containing protein [Ruegeria sp. Ofav3-42]|uniref:DUF4381 domain-containing protein n=1 Tax=Ruegeria sp. Ofav3-42 TaxID=2917759 RepID=UPI001EF41EB4|nr:DUF4381 domain-containing protein [Ruegeria sp. Ofav3-42]MCG7518221.1 DUF4381 domain-containing protein [Ruegeria sp. Ofav3-42]
MSVDVEGKSLVGLLDMLEPAPAPDPISMMPQTWGWVALALIVVGLIALCLYAVLRHRRTNAYRREALVELAASGDSAAKTAEILRRTALVAFPRKQVASLHGDKWVNFLKQTSEKASFQENACRALIEAPYRTDSTDPNLTKLARDWIKTHKRERAT